MSWASNLGTLDSRGFSLLEVLVSVGVVGIAAMAMSGMWQTNFAAVNSVELRSDRDAIKRMILSSASCSHTIPTGLCKPGALLKVLRPIPGGTQVLISNDSANPTRFGRWTARAECSASGVGIVVRVARLQAGATLTTPGSHTAGFVRDPLTKRLTTWETEDSLLFPGGVELCANSASAPLELHCERTEITPNADPIGAPSDYTKKHKCNKANQVMTECSAYLYPGGTMVCGTMMHGPDPLDGKVYCTNHGCGAISGQYWSTTATCCEVVLK